ncbi:uncharacterized protein EV420DRAFT_1639191 [Desarmillaria tabescens]|uniref:N-acetyltransferase domain-containing protein n=1 Tax=Armillaria tabescens TaxID=1929756 RepID=A0AA39TLB0_ARMTA|nr:uncharacterized protein EV420DRAFT_1639191 [Desarmillaria tabescens]KAK0463107.1 hypothetical protein EV420DRAFT_1639191 [Desarmillaria tabescens]
MTSEIMYRQYIGESDLPHVMALVQNELSEPYVIYTFRYFLHQWPVLHPSIYIATNTILYLQASPILPVRLSETLFEAMKEDGVEEIVLETEYDNHAALSLYESLGFIREKRLYRFYLNGKDAFRLILSVPPSDNVAAGKVRRGNVYGAIQVSDYTDDEDDDDSSVSER